ncbi:restriction endonuclease [Mesorhizobium sp. IMUNJ 23232]|uniref:restriction endonuclease n=1 Tax=Mesorhizobium sp. IMUNJ 23232 TaxID=3376064 RepID=UPI0037CB6F8F
MKEATAATEIADLLYNFLPGSGNGRTAFPLAAQEAGVGDYWQTGSKLPSPVQLLSATLEHRRNRFCPLISAIVRQSMTWRRGRNEPLTREEIEQLNALLLGVSFRIPELTDESFLGMLPRRDPPPVKPASSGPDDAQLTALSAQLIEISKLAPQPRGFAYEKFLKDLFEAYQLAPRGSFRLIGEQIDGSFQHQAETYLLEAKWQNGYSGVTELDAFSGKVTRNAKWARGLFISNTGFSPDGLTAFGKAPTSIVCMDGLDLHETLSRKLSLTDVIARKSAARPKRADRSFACETCFR